MIEKVLDLIKDSIGLIIFNHFYLFKILERLNFFLYFRFSWDLNLGPHN